MNMIDILKNNLIYCVLDTETTGLSPRNGDKLVEIAVHKIKVEADRFDIIDRFVTLLNPERSIPFQVSRIHGIYDIHVKESPKFYEISDSFLNFISEYPLVIQNAPFDLSFINNELSLCSKSDLTNQIIDTIKMSHKVNRGQTKHNLDMICHYLGINTKVDRHRAEGDVILTEKAFFIMRNKIINTEK